MKQRIVIEVSMTDLKSRSKVMKMAVGVPGVEAAAITGPEKNQLEVAGNGIDAAGLTKLIRKKVAYAGIVSVEVVEKQEEAVEKPLDIVEPIPPQVAWPFEPAASYYDGYRNYLYVQWPCRDTEEAT